MKLSLTLSVLLLFVGGCGQDAETRLICEIESERTISNINEPTRTEIRKYTAKVTVNKQKRQFTFNDEKCPDEYLIIDENTFLCGSRNKNNEEREEKKSKEIFESTSITTIEFPPSFFLDLQTLYASKSQTVSIIVRADSAVSGVSTIYSDKGQCKKIK